MAVTIVRHVPFEGPALILPWLVSRHIAFRVCDVWDGEDLPGDPGDGVISMGGPMSVHDRARFPWIEREQALIGAAIAAGVPTLGVCLGAQQMAMARGGAVVPCSEREIGWYPVTIDVARAPCALPSEATVFHWHGEGIDPSEPGDGAVIWAATSVCSTQAVSYGPRAVALQFHLEMDAAAVEAIIGGAGDELEDGGRLVQDASAMVTSAVETAPLLSAVLGSIFA